MKIIASELTDREAEAFAILVDGATDEGRVHARTLAFHYSRRAQERDGVSHPRDPRRANGWYAPRRFSRNAGLMLARLRDKGYLLIYDHDDEGCPLYELADCVQPERVVR